MVIRIASAVLTLAGLLALISGVLFWTGTALNLMALHMLLGFLAVGALWVIGAAQAFAPRGSWIIAACALIVGAVMIVLFTRFVLGGGICYLLGQWLLDLTSVLMMVAR